jgi:hypothetical protein
VNPKKNCKNMTLGRSWGAEAREGDSIQETIREPKEIQKY